MAYDILFPLKTIIYYCKKCCGELPYHRFLVFVSILTLVVSCSHNGDRHTQKDVTRLEELRKEATDAYIMNDRAKSDSLADLLYNEARRLDNDMYEAYGLLIKGCYPRTAGNTEERLKLVKLAEQKALVVGNDTLLSRVYNMLGIYASAYSYDFPLACRYYDEAIRYAERAGLDNLKIAAECNVAEIHYNFGDTLGFKYDFDIYEYALATDNKQLLVSASKRIADYYLSQTDRIDSALPFIDYIRDSGNLYLWHVMKGKYYLATDSLPKARHELDAAMSHDTITASAPLTYAVLLNKIGEYKASNENLELAEELSHSADHRGRIETMRLYADNMHRLENDTEAFKWLQKYTVARDSVVEQRNREELNRYKVKYDTNKKEVELMRRQAVISQQRHIIVSIVVIVILVILFWAFYIVRKKKMLRLIMRQSRDYAFQLQSVTQDDMTEKNNEDISEETQPVNTQPSQVTTQPLADTESSQDKSGLSDERAAQIWKAIVHEMESNKIYTDPDISREAFARRVGCNHTWFTKVIKEKTGKTYLQYINSRRISDAVIVLSNPQADTSIKSLAYSLGFSNLATFYSAFKQQVGMQPAQFRRLALQDSKEKENELKDED